MNRQYMLRFPNDPATILCVGHWGWAAFPTMVLRKCNQKVGCRCLEAILVWVGWHLAAKC